jgi:uncharacterized damage-inducible protein DinB
MHLLKACTTILTQLTNLVDQIKAEDFRAPSSTLDGSTIGQHLRHTIEFFLCLEEGLEKGIVNYDKRNHDKAIETDKFIAQALLTEIAESISKRSEDLPLTLEICYDLTDENFTSLTTSYKRELVYNIEHAVHHMAIIKIGVRDIAPYIQLPDDFGIAASTIRHQHTDRASVSR